jgi:hypothetical protein
VGGGAEEEVEEVEEVEEGGGAEEGGAEEEGGGVGVGILAPRLSKY